MDNHRFEDQRNYTGGLRALIPILLLGAMLLSGCAQVRAPVFGGLYSDTSAPVTATSSQVDATKRGTASAESYLGIIATGDASIQAAAESANISEIHHVDYESENILGLYAKYTVVVYGE